MRQSLWRRAWRRLLVCTVEGGCFLNRERRDVCLYAVLGERLCAPRMFLVVSAEQGAELVTLSPRRTSTGQRVSIPVRTRWEAIGTAIGTVSVKNQFYLGFVNYAGTTFS